MNELTIAVGDIVFYNDPHEALLTNLIRDVLEDLGQTVLIRARGGLEASVRKERLTKLPIDKDFPLYLLANYKKPKYSSPD